MIKAMVLLHMYDNDRFVGQSIVTWEASDLLVLVRAVSSAFGGAEVTVMSNVEVSGIPSKLSRESFGLGTNVRIMQIIPMDDAEEPPAETPLPKATPISSAGDLQLRAASVHMLLESSRVPSPQERANGMHTIAILRALAKERLSIHGSPNEHVRIVDEKMRPS